MRDNALLSPHRARTRDDLPHDRHIITEAPNMMWATDATQIITVQDGKVWLFGVIEHWNAEVLGWHVAKRGDRCAAVQAVGMAVRNAFGHVSPSAARGVALRHDHGSAFLAEHFHNQIRFWGMTPSYAFVGEPETNGVIERSSAPSRSRSCMAASTRPSTRSVAPSAISSPATTPSG